MLRDMVLTVFPPPTASLTCKLALVDRLHASLNL